MPLQATRKRDYTIRIYVISFVLRVFFYPLYISFSFHSMTCDAACYTLSTEEWPRRFINLGAAFLLEVVDIFFRDVDIG